MIVADCSAILDALLPGAPQELIEELGAADEIAVPHLVDLELLQVLRRLLRGGARERDLAELRADYGALPLTRFPHHVLADRVWELRQNATAYDAAYLALAEVLEVPLLTSDARLAAVPGIRTEVHVHSRRRGTS
jgi:predicted nucleic acid-binding protein